MDKAMDQGSYVLKTIDIYFLLKFTTVSHYSPNVRMNVWTLHIA